MEINSTLQNKIKEQNQTEISDLERKILVELDDIAPREYVNQAEEWMTDAHAGDWREIANQHNIPLHIDMAGQIAEKVFDNMRQNREIYNLPPAVSSDT